MPLSDDDCDVHHIFGVLRFESGNAVARGSWGAAKLDPAGQYIEQIELGSIDAAPVS